MVQTRTGKGMKQFVHIKSNVKLGVDQPARKRGVRNQKNQSSQLQQRNLENETIPRNQPSRSPSPDQRAETRSPSTHHPPEATAAKAVSTTGSSLDRVKDFYYDLNNPLSYSGNIRTLVNKIDSLKYVLFYCVVLICF